MKIEMPIQVNMPVEEVIEYLKKDGTLVEVVRCKDCKLTINNGYGCCRYDAPVNPEDFCSYGERKEEEE